MATKKELLEEIEQYATELGVDVETDNLTVPQLNELVEKLDDQLGEKLEREEKEKASAAENQDDKGPPPAPPAPPAGIQPSKPAERQRTPPSVPPVKAAKPPYPVSIASGKAVNSARGLLREGAEVLESDFDPDTFEKLHAKGCFSFRDPW